MQLIRAKKCCGFCHDDIELPNVFTRETKAIVKEIKNKN